MNTKRVSFILPAFKRQFFAKAIASILAQTVSDFDLIIVDDASPEKLAEVVNQFNDPRIRYYRNDRNIGGTNLISNWNLALSYAQSEFCVLASDDDIYHPEYLERMLFLAARYPSVNLFHCRILMIDGDDTPIGISPCRPEYERCLDFVFDRAVNRVLQVAPEFFFRREPLVAQGGFVDFPLAWYSDDATWMMLARKNGVAYCSETLFYWRYSGINISARFDKTAHKIQAAEQYKKWLFDFLDELAQEGPTEKILLRICKERAEISVDKQSLFDLDDTHLWPWLKLLFTGKVKNNRLFLRSIQRRVKKICGL